ncbi:hypothetical protein BG262_02925 [Floricoccus penangensis]|uniref:Holin n=1 Tax=Floricoccus penangensis TaxID=1859475 RepID=A0A9Q5JG71_9LACT|nr:hypothetical protein [Floricoccus penangensis]OFI46768.1 hypothetical protein BG262_02925 [Floricoccus penangensis]
MDKIIAVVPVIGTLVFAVTSLIKKELPNNKHLPVINCVTGISLGLIYALTIVRGEFAIYGWAGFIAGLSAGGFYDLGKSYLGGKDYGSR